MKLKIKIKLKILVDILLFLSGMMSAITGVVLFFMPSGPGTRAGQTAGPGIFDLTTRSSLRLLHDWSSILLIAMVVFHLLLNFSTIVCYLKLLFRAAKKNGCENL